MPRKYDNLTKEQLIVRLEALESRKKYGLVWEEERVKEQFEQDAVNSVPVLKEVKSRVVASDPSQPTHILIEGDNYHALTVLNYTHQGKVDVIYIDPPYNKGSKNFKYNDHWVEEDDTYKHSKWLSFMSKRLCLARSLLKEAGIIYISIDDNEFARLKLICDEVFGEKSFVGTVTWEKRTKAQNTETAKEMFQSKTEYVLVYKRTTEKVRFKLEVTGEKIYDLQDEVGLYRLKLIEEMSATGMRGRQTMIFPIEGISPRDGFQWKIGQDQVGRYRDRGDIEVVEGKAYLKVRPADESKEKFMPFWSHFFDKDTYGTAEKGKAELTEILGSNQHEFETVKPINLIKKLLFHINRDKKEIVLDFFAGSGTAGHAVLDLNQDGGQRQFILCTNNEEGICQDVCYPRLKKVMQGYADKPALGGNLKYFKTHFISKTANKDDLKIRVTRECAELLCLREGIFNEVSTAAHYRLFEEGGRVMAVYYSLDRRDLSKLKKELDKKTGKKILYCLTLDPLGLDVNDFEDWDGVELRDIPKKILDIYEGLK
jgi:adenine-specific DNA-methyltransferase